MQARHNTLNFPLGRQLYGLISPFKSKIRLTNFLVRILTPCSHFSSLRSNRRRLWTRLSNAHHKCHKALSLKIKKSKKNQDPRAFGAKFWIFIFLRARALLLRHKFKSVDGLKIWISVLILVSKWCNNFTLGRQLGRVT